MAAYRLYNVVPAIISAVDDLTNWYVRRSRRRFWKSDNDGDKMLHMLPCKSPCRFQQNTCSILTYAFRRDLPASRS